MGWSASARRAAAEARKRKAAGKAPVKAAKKLTKTAIDYRSASGPPPAAKKLHGNFPGSKHIKPKTVGEIKPGDTIVTPNGGLRDVKKVVRRRDGFIAIHTQGQMMDKPAEHIHSSGFKFDVISPQGRDTSRSIEHGLSPGARRAKSLMTKILEFDNPLHPESDVDKLVNRGFSLQRIHEADLIEAVKSLYPHLKESAAIDRFAGHLDSRNNTLMERMHRWAEEARARGN